MQSAIPQLRSRAAGGCGSASSRAKSLLATTRPGTAPAQTIFSEDFLLDPDDSPVTPTKPPPRLSLPRPSTDLQSSNNRITWPVQIKVFGLQDEDEARQKYLEWTADQRRMRSKRSSKPQIDSELEQKYRQSVRRRQEIESFITPEIIEEHQINDPVFAKRYRQLQLAIRAGRCPVYDINDREVHLTMTKSRMERTRTAMIAAKRSQMKDFYRHQQRMNDAKLSKRVEHFLKRLTQFKQELNQENEDQ